MHKVQVNHVLVSQKYEFIITISIDGCVKFWKKTMAGIEFVKAFKAHTNPISSAVVSKDQERLLTTCPLD